MLSKIFFRPVYLIGTCYAIKSRIYALAYNRDHLSYVASSLCVMEFTSKQRKLLSREEIKNIEYRIDNEGL